MWSTLDCPELSGHLEPSGPGTQHCLVRKHEFANEKAVNDDFEVCEKPRRKAAA